ncbi:MULTISPECIES: hypothetical protein [unclassified Burkholderia]|uniref:hypothetical protein n=1 Tax=unclassified Burkholderia TaxID=2613784 RepID=UPI002AB2CAE2|nr:MULTISPECIES: hypothetical protein [unclassified Burkholderia]
MEIIHAAAETVEIIMAGRTLLREFLRLFKANEQRDGPATRAGACDLLARFVVVDRHGRALCMSADDRFFMGRPARGIAALQFADKQSAAYAIEQIEAHLPGDGQMTVRPLGEYIESVQRYEATLSLEAPPLADEQMVPVSEADEGFFEAVLEEDGVHLDAPGCRG